MKLKPKNTTLNTRALLYKRYTGLNLVANKRTVYVTEDNKKWLYDNDSKDFYSYDDGIEFNGETTFMNVYNNSTTLVWKGIYYRYSKFQWVKSETPPVALSQTIKSNNIGKFEINKYLYAGSFSYVINGTESDTYTQPIKGAITPLKSFEIKHFDDSIKAQEGDLVVIDGQLFAVETTDKDHKHMPKDYNVYFMTLTSIL